METVILAVTATCFLLIIIFLVVLAFMTSLGVTNRYSTDPLTDEEKMSNSDTIVSINFIFELFHVHTATK